MTHIGDICNINGAEIEPVDCVIGGSPCQDLSIAWKRAGLAGNRSGLFMEQIRIIKLHKKSSDSARYKAMGNSIALPPWKWVLKRLCANYERDATLGSLFDGVGGFPLIWSQLNGVGSVKWASEVEEFPIAVTKRHCEEGLI